MDILVLHDSSAIQGWLINEPLESAGEHIEKGYTGLLPGWQNGAIFAKVISVPEDDAYRPDLYEVTGDSVVRKSA